MCTDKRFTRGLEEASGSVCVAGLEKQAANKAQGHTKSFEGKPKPPAAAQLWSIMSAGQGQNQLWMRMGSQRSDMVGHSSGKLIIMHLQRELN